MQSMNNLVQPTQLPRGKKLTGMLVEKLKLNASETMGVAKAWIDP